MARRHKWKPEQPIYRQLIDELIGGMLAGKFAEGDMLPSVRQLAATYDVNPLTVAKAFRELSRENLIETVRGEGVQVRRGVVAGLRRRERTRFLAQEWPALRTRLERMAIDPLLLLTGALE